VTHGRIVYANNSFKHDDRQAEARKRTGSTAETQRRGGSGGALR
jgi:hypothetical protein